MPKAIKAIDYLAAQKWAIQQETLTLMADIAQRAHEAPEALLMREPDDSESRYLTIVDGIGILHITGPVFRYANLFTMISGATSIEILAERLGEALADSQVKEIILDIDSPGGQVNGTQEFSELVYQAREKKPVYAYVSDLGASAAYWMASAASEIIASPTARLGSIGVITTFYKDDEKDSTVTLVSSQSPNKLRDPESEQGLSQIQAEVDDLADVFIESVARNRGVSSDTVLSDFGQGRVFVGQKAVNAGLADRLGNLENLIDEIKARRDGRALPNSSTFRLTKEDHIVPITMETLKAEAPELLAQIQQEAKATSDDEKEKELVAAKAEAVNADRERIKAILNNAPKGFEEQAANMAFEGKTPEDVAMAFMVASKDAGIQTLQSLQQDSPSPVAPSNSTGIERPASVNRTGKVTKAQAEAEFKASAALQEIYADAEQYFYSFPPAKRQGGSN